MRRSGHTLLRRRVYIPAAVTALIAVVILSVVLHLGGTSDAGAGQTSAGAPVCGTSADTAAGGTLLGVTASTTGQLNKANAEFGSLPIIRVYYTGMPDPQTWKTGAPTLSHSAVVLSFRSPPAEVLSGADDAALTHFFDGAPAAACAVHGASRGCVQEHRAPVRLRRVRPRDPGGPTAMAHPGRRLPQADRRRFRHPVQLAVRSLDAASGPASISAWRAAIASRRGSSS
jgi:hypothetical protein